MMSTYYDTSAAMSESYRRALMRSRRGLLELDLLLVPFTQAVYHKLSEAEQQAYEQLLLEEDTRLLDCRIRREGANDRVKLKRMPHIWGPCVVLSVPETELPFGILWLTEPVLGARLLRQVRSLAFSALRE